MMNRTLLTTAALLLPALLQAQTPDAALLRCAPLSDAARLACYDALAAQARQRGPASTATATPAATLPANDPAKVAEFGRPPKPDNSDIDVLESRIAGAFEGWRPRQRFTLANGQVWEISDDSSGYADLRDPVVRVRRAALGSYMLEIDGVKRSPRVRRVQ